MLVGYPPFYSDDPVTTCRKVWLLFSFVWFLLFQLNHDTWLALMLCRSILILWEILFIIILFSFWCQCVWCCVMTCTHILLIHALFFFNLTSTCWFQEKKMKPCVGNASWYALHYHIIVQFGVSVMLCYNIYFDFAYAPLCFLIHHPKNEILCFLLKYCELI